MTHDYLLGNAALHARFFATTEILAKLVSRAPRAVSISQLEAETGRPARELARLCQALGRSGVLCQDGQCNDKWRLAGEPSEVTLEDVFRCIIEQQAPPRAGKTTPEAAAASDVDLLLMQAMIAINQSVSSQLRRFSLDRVKASASPVFPLPRHAARTRDFEEDIEPPLAGRKATQDSPVHLAA
jgi:DNA-binding IscR family transcriptional regulator